jgi:hypothetical protein
MLLYVEEFLPVSYSDLVCVCGGVCVYSFSDSARLMYEDRLKTLPTAEREVSMFCLSICNPRNLPTALVYLSMSCVL